MLEIVVAQTDDLPPFKLEFEHSLLTVSKWESIHQKAFYGREEKTKEESESYIKCMVQTKDYPLNFLKRLSKSDYDKIAEYINSKQSATTFGPEPEKRGTSELMTSELVYYWMVQFRIPFDPCERWHFNRLMTLIKIAGIKQSKPKKMSRQQLAEQYRTLNQQRREQTGSAG